VASVCDVCGKGPGFGNNISHSHRRTRRRWNPNIQTVRAMVGRTPRTLVFSGGSGVTGTGETVMGHFLPAHAVIRT